MKIFRAGAHTLLLFLFRSNRNLGRKCGFADAGE